MKRLKMALLSIALISAILVSTLVILTQRTTAAPRDPLFEYRANWICNAPTMPSPATVPPSAPAYPDVQFLRSWNVSKIFGLAVDSSGNVYAADTDNNRIEKFTSTGTLITQWGSLGSGNGQFNIPAGVAVDSSGNIYVADEGNNRIQKFTSTGVFLLQWGSFGSGDGQFDRPLAIAVDSVGNVFVADIGHDRVEMFTNTGIFENSVGSTGNGDGQFNNIDSVAADSSGNIYVVDINNHRIEKFHISELQIRFVMSWGQAGVNGALADLRGIGVDTSGNVYVVDSDNDRILKYTNTGGFILSWGFTGNGPGQVNEDAALAVDNSGNVYLTSSAGSPLQVYAVSDPLNAERIGLTPGEYLTSIDIHNPSRSLNLSITKNFILSTPEPLNLPVPAGNFTTRSFLGPDASFITDCNEILSSLGKPVTTPAMGYVVITTNNRNLDVTANYSQFTGTGSSLQVEQIAAHANVP